MDTKTLALLARYNAKTNETMNALIRTLTDEQWNQKFDGYFRSVKSMCNHIYIGDFNWLQRFSGLRQFNYVRDSLFAEKIGFDRRVLEGIDSYVGMRKALDAKFLEFTSEITGADLEKPLIYVDSGGTSHERNFGGLVLHCFNHQTHHRGMISLYLESMGVSNDFSNLCEML